ncbi:hypothetical protein CF319_g1911 [Tilletia indica]|nr:hypothetical protein CF326_g9139 [Tilletia indica]KAE8225320.1 hypothetical protein CF319_g1911 [Tilletia indica]
MARHSKHLAARLQASSLRRSSKANKTVSTLKDTSSAIRASTAASSQEQDTKLAGGRRSSLSSTSEANRTVGIQSRIPWTETETKCLMDALNQYAHLRAKGQRIKSVFRAIWLRHGPAGSETQALRGRDTIQMRSKARAELERRYKKNVVMPYWQPILFPKFLHTLGCEIALDSEKMPSELDESSADNGAHRAEQNTDASTNGQPIPLLNDILSEVLSDAESEEMSLERRATQSRTTAGDHTAEGSVSPTQALRSTLLNTPGMDAVVDRLEEKLLTIVMNVRKDYWATLAHS